MCPFSHSLICVFLENSYIFIILPHFEFKKVVNALQMSLFLACFPVKYIEMLKTVIFPLSFSVQKYTCLMMHKKQVLLSLAALLLKQIDLVSSIVRYFNWK